MPVSADSERGSGRMDEKFQNQFSKVFRNNENNL